MRRKILKYILFFAIFLCIIIAIGLWIYPVKDWDKTLNNEGFWYFVRIFATIIGTGIGAFSAYLVAEHTFNRNRIKEEEKEKRRKEIIKKKIFNSFPIIIGNLCAQVKSLKEEITFLENLVKSQSFAVKPYIPLAIPFFLILNTPENELFEILIVDNEISDMNIIGEYNLLYASLVMGNKLQKQVRKNREKGFKLYNFFVETIMNKYSRELASLTRKKQISEINEYWDIIKKINKEKYISTEQINKMIEILEKEKSSLTNPESKELNLLLDQIVLEIINQKSFYFNGINHVIVNLKKHLFNTEKLIGLSDSLIKYCYTNEEYYIYKEIIKSKFGFDLIKESKVD